MSPFTALACASLIVAPSLSTACDEEGVGTDARAVPFETRVVVRQGAWLDSELDSTWTALEPATFLLRLRRPGGAWVAEYWFYRLAARPEQALTLEEMAQLEADGYIDEMTESGLVVYQVLLYAQDAAQASRLATAMRPRAVPARVAEALDPALAPAWH
ncbi:MAG: hypothetical protein ABIP29_11690 [Candidatus Eisenbacteria bacterium]